MWPFFESHFLEKHLFGYKLTFCGYFKCSNYWWLFGYFVDISGYFCSCVALQSGKFLNFHQLKNFVSQIHSYYYYYYYFLQNRDIFAQIRLIFKWLFLKTKMAIFSKFNLVTLILKDIYSHHS